jgi:hypothetical protein
MFAAFFAAPRHRPAERSGPARFHLTVICFHRLVPFTLGPRAETMQAAGWWRRTRILDDGTLRRITLRIATRVGFM